MAQACAALGVEATLVDIDQIHLLTAAVAAGFERPMAPVSSFILGAASTSGRGLPELRALIVGSLPDSVPAGDRSAPEPVADQGGRRHRAVWDTWVAEACRASGVEARLVDIDAVLSLTKEVAHRFERPMAPVSSFILGAALATGGDFGELRARLEASLPEPVSD